MFQERFQLWKRFKNQFSSSLRNFVRFPHCLPLHSSSVIPWILLYKACCYSCKYKVSPASSNLISSWNVSLRFSSIAAFGGIVCVDKWFYHVLALFADIDARGVTNCWSIAAYVVLIQRSNFLGNLFEFLPTRFHHTYRSPHIWSAGLCVGPSLSEVTTRFQICRQRATRSVVAAGIR